MPDQCPCRLCTDPLPYPAKVVFLDFDGVLNQVCGPFLQGPVHELNRITTIAGASIVVHSSWRNGRTMDHLKGILREAEVTGEILGATPVPKGGDVPDSGILVLDEEDLDRFVEPGSSTKAKWAYERPGSIQTWLDTHPEVTVFVILDDASFMGHLEPRHLRTDMRVGLTRDHSDQAIRMLRGIPW